MTVNLKPTASKNFTFKKLKPSVLSTTRGVGQPDVFNLHHLRLTERVERVGDGEPGEERWPRCRGASSETRFKLKALLSLFTIKL